MVWRTRKRDSGGSVHCRISGHHGGDWHIAECLSGRRITELRKGKRSCVFDRSESAISGFAGSAHHRHDICARVFKQKVNNRQYQSDETNITDNFIIDTSIFACPEVLWWFARGPKRNSGGR